MEQRVEEAVVQHTMRFALLHHLVNGKVQCQN